MFFQSFKYDAGNKIFYFCLQDEKQIRIDAGIVAMPYEIGRIVSFFLSDVRVSLLHDSEKEFYRGWIQSATISDPILKKQIRDRILQKQIGVSLFVGPKGKIISKCVYSFASNFKLIIL